MADILQLHPEHPQKRHVDRVVEALHRGGVIVYPTDTVYGLGCDIFNRKAINRIYQIKQAPAGKPLSFVCSDLSDLARYAKNISNAAYRMMKRLLPGPYTFILEASRDVPKFMIGKRRTVGIRVPDNRICLEIVQALGRPVLSTSIASAVDGIAINDIESIASRYGKAVDVIVDGGAGVTEPSTVVDLTGEEPDILRAGAAAADLY
ncbi:MAG: L-threonylcarbamoyladenylate synthase [Gemmatimonadetes bacterium]|nr:L-threonylcarbamoyladenylate synthase [Gemmatimonadota bacterium]